MYTNNLIRILILATVFLFYRAPVYAQPQYSYTSPTTSNSIPLGASTSYDNYKSQWLYLPGDFAPGVPTGSVEIVAVYFKVGTTGTTATTYNNFKIALGNVTQTALTTTYVTGLTTALNELTYAIPAIATGVWMKIDLTTPVTVDLSKPLVVEVSQTGRVGATGGYSLYSGGVPVNPAFTGNTQTYGANATATTGTARVNSYQFGIDVTCRATITSQPADYFTCASDSAVFTAMTSNAQALHWQVNIAGVWTDLVDDGIHEGTQTGKLTIKNMMQNMNQHPYRLVATNSCSSFSDPAILNIVPNVQSSILIAAQPDTVICKHEQVVFHTFYTYGGSSPGYQWQKNGVDIPGETAATFQTTGLDHGDYISCNLISSEQCAFNSTSPGIIFTVNNIVPTSVDLSVENHGMNSYTFTALPTNGGTAPTFNWYLNNKLLPAETGSTFTANNLQAYDKVNVTMMSSKDCAMPQVATSRQATTSVSMISKGTDFTLSPNPNKGKFTLRFDERSYDHVSVTVINNIGQIIYRANAQTGNGKVGHEIDLGGGARAGIYIIRLETSGGQQQMKFTVAD